MTSRMRRTIRLAHTSDVHLDGNASTNPVNGYRNVAEAAFAFVVDQVREEKCDLFLVVGDLFDHARIKSHDIDFVCNEFDKLNCPIIVIPGNHDVHDERSVWSRFESSRLGNNVHLILSEKGSSLEFPDLGISLWGRAMVEHTPDNQPLRGVPGDSQPGWNIGLAHGQVVSNQTDYVSSTISEEEIANSGLDYLALGHVHVWQDYKLGNTVACYPGSPVKAFATARGGFFALVTLSEDGVSLEKREVPAPKNVEKPNYFHFAPGV